MYIYKMATQFSSHIAVYFCIILLQIFVTDSASSVPISIPTCNRVLEGNEITVHGLQWDQIKIRLSTNSPKYDLKCDDGEDETEFKILDSSELRTLEKVDEAVPPVSKLESTANGTYFTQDGLLAVVFKGKGDHHYFGKEEYCITNASDASMTIKYCKPSCKGNRPCILKCCPYDETYNTEDEVGCEPTKPDVKWSPFFYNDVHQPKPSNKSTFSPHYLYNLFYPKCPYPILDRYYNLDNRHRLFDEADKLSFKLLQNGSLAYLTVHGKWERPENDLFCIDAIQGWKFNSSGLESEQVIFTCASTENPNEAASKQMSTAYMVSMYVASIFLLLTCIMYLLLWDKQNVQGWTIFSLVSSMFFWYIFMGTAHLLGIIHGQSNISEIIENEPSMDSKNDGSNAEGYFCTINAVLAHFFFLSTFSWLTIINFDLFLSFKTLTSVTGQSKGFKKFSTYATLSWGLPLIVVIVGLVLDYKYPDRGSSVVTPEYGKAFCFVAPWAQGEYLYHIITTLLLLNFIFVGSTFYFLYAAKKVTGSVRSSNSNHKQETFVLVAKLSVVMGVTWVFEVISWYATEDKDATAWYWVVLDLYNVFQAVLIFIIFVCKRTVMTQLEQKYSVFKVIFVACGCAMVLSYLSSPKSSSGTSGTEGSTSTGNNVYNTDSSNQSSVGLNTLGNELNSNTNELDLDQRTPNLRSFKKPDSSTPLLHPSSPRK